MTARMLVLWRVLLIAAAAGVAWSSLLPPDDLPAGVGGYDKALHALGYAVLGVLAVLSGIRWPLAIAVVIAFGLVIEGAQGIVGYRSFEWADLVADGLGAVAGVLLTARIREEMVRSRSGRMREQKRADRRARREARRSPVVERPRNAARAAARRGAPTWQQVTQRQGPKCWLCGTRTYEEDRVRDASGVEHLGRTYPCVDVVTPIESGGTYEDGNVRLAHRHCAAARRDNPGLQEFGRPPRTYS